MYVENIILGDRVWIDPTASINNVCIGDDVVIGNRCTIFGSQRHLLKIGKHSRIGMLAILNGYSAPLVIGNNCSVGALCHFIADSGPNSSPRLLVKYPIEESGIFVGDHCHVGASCFVLAGVSIGKCSVVLPNSFVNRSVPPFCMYGGSPAKFIRKVEI